MTAKRILAILNLAGELPKELGNFFSSREIQVINPLVDNTKLEWTHIITSEVEDFGLIDNTYQTNTLDIRIMSLSKVLDLKNFVLNNGKIIFDEKWLDGSLGGFILDKFFQEYAGINVDDNYPSFKEVGAFNISNPFSTGEYLDRLVFNAFENGTNALAAKTYFDHILMYLSGLRNKNKIGMPIEVSYGTLDNVFGLQMHFFAQNLSIDDVVMSLSNSITKTPEEYLLNIAVQSSDFFDFTFLAGVNKVVMTALWTQDTSIKVENRGLMFTSLNPSAKIGMYQSENAPAFVVQDVEIEDMSGRVNLPSRPIEMPEVEVEAALVEEEAVTVLKGSKPEAELVTKVSGGEEEKERSQVIKGKKEEKDNFSQTISGGGEDDGKGKFNVKSLGGTPAANMASFFQSGNTSEKEKVLEEKLKLATSENDSLKTRVKILMSEVQGSKDTQKRMNELRVKAVEETPTTVLQGNPDDDELRKKYQLKLKENKGLSPQEMSKLGALMEKESKFIEEARQNEVKIKKLQLELAQKDAIFMQELEKVQRMVSTKDIIVEKAKESLVRVTEKKDEEINALKNRFEQVNKVLAAGPNQNQQAIVKDLEKQNINLNKMLDVYKNKLTSLATSIESNKDTDDTVREEARRTNMINAQLKNQFETTKKDFDKIREKNGQDLILIGNLRQEKAALEALVKRLSSDTPKAQALTNATIELELRKSQSQNQILEVQVREIGLKLKESERKLTETLKNTKTGAGGAPEENSKAKVNHLETSVKKLTTDLMASQNQTAEMKKETNKLRSENQALQNQLAQTKKDLEKFKPATPKTSGTGGTGGKAA